MSFPSLLFLLLHLLITLLLSFNNSLAHHLINYPSPLFTVEENMELVQELFVTAVVAVLFSFLIAKLVSVASGGDSSCDFKCKHIDEEITEGLQFRGKLEVDGSKSEERAQEVVRDVVEKVDKVVRVEEMVKSMNFKEVTGTECGELNRESNQEGVKEDDKSLDEMTLHNKIGESADMDVFEQSEEKNEQFVAEEVKEANLLKENKEDEAIGNEVVEKSEEIVVAESELKEKVGEKTTLEIVVDEDDWEGIERTELEVVFAEVAKFVESEEREEKLASIGSDVQMELYGLHKVATEGPCHEQPPMALKVSARAKWNAWQRLGSMSPEAAMEQYVKLVSDRVPGWTGVKPTGDNKPGSFEEATPAIVGDDNSGMPEAASLGVLGDDKQSSDTTSADVVASKSTDERNPKLKIDDEETDLIRGANLENVVKE